MGTPLQHEAETWGQVAVENAVAPLKASDTQEGLN